MEDDNEDKDFSYHLSDGLAEEEIDDHGELGGDAVGTSPLVTSAGGKVGKVDISQIGFRKSLKIECMIKKIFLLPSLTKSFLALHAVATRSTTPQHGF
jgi:hypothetical protein